MNFKLDVVGGTVIVDTDNKRVVISDNSVTVTDSHSTTKLESVIPDNQKIEHTQKESEKTYIDGKGTILAPVKRPMSQETKDKIRDVMKKNRDARKSALADDKKHLRFDGVPTLRCNKCAREYTWQSKRLTPRCGSCGCQQYEIVGEDE